MPDRTHHRLGVLVTHPVQYFAPLFRAVAADPRVDLTVYYAHSPTAKQQGAEFEVPFTWDIDLISGYRSIQLQNRSRTPGDGFFGYNTPEIARIVSRERFDAFVVSGWHALTYWQAMRACWRSDTPLLVRGDSHLEMERSGATRLTKGALYPLFMRRFASCMAVGKRSAEYFRHHGARRVDLVPHFVDNARFAASAVANADQARVLRARHGIPDDAMVVLFAGKFISRKQPLESIRAVAACGEDVHLLMVGDGALRPECESEARRGGASGRIHFAGFMNQSEIPVAYAAADLLLLPALEESWGLVVNEAMACGRPAVVSDAVGCAPDLVIEGVTGHTYPVGNVERMSYVLSTLANDRNHLAAMGRAAQQRIADWSLEAAATSFIAAAVGAARPSRQAA